MGDFISFSFVLFLSNYNCKCNVDGDIVTCYFKVEMPFLSVRFTAWDLLNKEIALRTSMKIIGIYPVAFQQMGLANSHDLNAVRSTNVFCEAVFFIRAALIS